MLALWFVATSLAGNALTFGDPAIDHRLIGRAALAPDSCTRSGAGRRSMQLSVIAEAGSWW